MRKLSIIRFFQTENRLRAFPNLENTSLTLIQGNECFVLKRKYENFRFFSKIIVLKLRLQWAEIGAENRKIGQKVVTMQPKIGSRKTEPEIGKRKCGYNERFFDFPIFGPVFRKIGFFGKCGYNERFLAPIFGKPEIFSDRIFRSDFFIGFRFFEMC